jgi:hypothetical protein
VRLAHGWRLETSAPASRALIRDFIRPAVRAAPDRIAARLGACRILLAGKLVEEDWSSNWVWTPEGLDIALGTQGREDHDVGVELLLCLGEALWEKLEDAETRGYLQLLDAEIRAGVPGEIDEEALRHKSLLLTSRASARSRSRLSRYARASFTGTAAEYMHSLWHDVSVRSGPEHLPADALRRRLALLARWFPPRRGYRLFA